MKKTFFLLFCLLIAVSACRQSMRTVPADNPQQGTTEEEASVESFYDEQKASEARNEQPATNIRMMELPAPLKDRPEQILRKKDSPYRITRRQRYPTGWHGILRSRIPMAGCSAIMRCSLPTTRCPHPVPSTTTTIHRATTAATCALPVITNGMHRL